MSKQIDAQVPITPQTFLDIAGVMFLALDKRGNITLINQKGCDILESIQKEIIGKNWFDHFVPKGMVKNIKSVFLQLMDGKVKPVEYYENSVLTKAGKEKIIAWHNTILRDEKGKICGTLSSGEDITEKRLMQVEQKKAIQMAREAEIAANLGSWSWNLNTNRIEWSDHLCKIHGIQPGEFDGQFETVMRFVHPDDLHYVRKETEQMIAKKTSIRFQYRIITKDGVEKNVEGTNQITLDADGRIAQIVGTVQDVSGRFQLEEKLEKERQDLKLIINTSPIIVFYKDLKGRFVRVNKVFADALKMSEKEFIGKTVFDLYSRKIAQDMTNDDRQVVSSGRAKLNIIEKYESASGIRWVQTDKIPIFDKKGVPIGLIGYAQDITERKRAEDEVQKMAKFPIQNPNPVLSITIHGDVQFNNRAGLSLLRIWKYRKNQPLSGEPLKRIRKVYRTNKQEQIEIDVNHKTYLLTFSPVKNSDIVNIYGMDITERKKAEDRIMHLNAILRAIRNINQLITHETDPKKLIKGACENLVKVRGYKSAWIVLLDNTGNFSTYAEAGIGQKFGSVVKMFQKGNRPLCCQKVLKQAGVLVVKETNVYCSNCPIYTIYPNDKYMVLRLSHGRTVYGLINVSVPSEITIDSEEKRLFQEIVNDIAFALHDIEIEMKRKEVLGALQRSEEQFRQFFENEPEYCYMISTESIILNVNQTALHTLGYKKEELVGKPLQTIYASESVKKVERLHKLWKRTGKLKDEELVIVTKKGKKRHVLLSAGAIRDSDGNILHSISVQKDITERKQAEEMLMEKEETIRAFVETSRDWIWSIDLNGNHTYSNPAVEKMLGYPPVDLIGRSSLEFMHEEDRHTIETKLPQWIKEKIGWKNVIIRWKHKNGGYRWLESNAVPIFDITEKLIGFRGVDRDITERKQTEALIQVRMRLMEFAVTHSLKELLRKTLDEVCKFTNSLVGFYHFVEPDQKTLSLQVWSTRTIKEFCHANGKSMHYSIDEAGVWVDCIRERRPVIHNDYASLPHRKGMPEGHVAIVRDLVVPIMRNDCFVAILGVGNKPQDYDDQDVQIVSYLADVAWEIAEHKQAEEALRESEEKFRLMVSEVKDYSIIMLDPKGFITSWNEGAQSINGYRAEEIMGKHYSCFFTNSDIKMNKPMRILNMASKRGRLEEEVLRVRKDGTKFIAHIVITAIRDKKGRLKGYSKVTRDVTDRKKAEDTLKESEEQLRTFIEQAPTAILVHDIDGRILLMNNLACKYTGYSKEELVKMNVSEIDHEVISKEHRKIYWDKLNIHEYVGFEGIHERKDHSTYPSEIHIVKIKYREQPMILGFFNDISERRKAEELIKKDLREKEVLLREIHHRVKNNLQIIKSLLNLQSNQVKSKNLTKAFNECVNRIQSMAMVHEQLYYSNDFSHIPFKAYIERISKELMSSYRLDKVVTLNMKIEDIFLGIDKAIPLGLILNELLTNALKYAFLDREKGIITISLKLRENQLYELIFKDNGVGISDDVDFKDTESLGLYLIKILTEQIDGTIVLKRRNGTIFKVVFPKT